MNSAEESADERRTRQVAVVTGGGSGLGAVLAHRFADEDMAVAVIDIDGERASTVAQSIVSGGGMASAFQGDVTVRARLDQIARDIAEAFGGCNVLCANAGVVQFGALERLTEQDWRWVLDVNVLGPVNTVMAFLPILRRSSGMRRILLTSSSSALSPGARLGAYATSKFAVTGFGETLRIELAPEDIGVSILFPAGMRTPFLELSPTVRPPSLGPSVTLPDDHEVMLASRDTTTDEYVVDPEYAVRNVLTDLRNDEPYIVTHAPFRDRYEARVKALHAALDRADI